MALQSVSPAGSLLVVLCIQFSIGLIDGQPATGQKCPPVAGSPGCVCDHPDFGMIDLTPFGNTNGNPKYTGLPDPNNYKYSYNPCSSYSVVDADGCTNVFACQEYDSQGIFYDIADANTEEIYTESDGKTIYLYYTGPDSRYVRVYLQCDTSASATTVTTTGDSAGVILHYVFNMTSPDLCFGGSAAAGGEIAGVVGLVFIFLFIGAIIGYFIVGAIIMKYKFQASGTDMIPNKAFWLAFPLLIRDGFVFTFGPCVTLVNEKVRGYQRT